MVSFLQLAAKKKDTIFGAARKIFEPSYFIVALDCTTSAGLLCTQSMLECLERISKVITLRIYVPDCLYLFPYYIYFLIENKSVCSKGHFFQKV